MKPFLFTDCTRYYYHFRNYQKSVIHIIQMSSVDERWRVCCEGGESIRSVVEARISGVKFYNVNMAHCYIPWGGQQYLCFQIIPSMKLVSICLIIVRRNCISFLVFSNMMRGSSDSQRRQLGAITIAKLLMSILVTATFSGAANTWTVKSVALGWKVVAKPMTTEEVNDTQHTSFRLAEHRVLHSLTCVWIGLRWGRGGRVAQASASDKTWVKTAGGKSPGGGVSQPKPFVHASPAENSGTLHKEGVDLWQPWSGPDPYRLVRTSIIFIVVFPSQVKCHYHGACDYETKTLPRPVNFLNTPWTAQVDWVELRGSLSWCNSEPLHLPQVKLSQPCSEKRSLVLSFLFFFNSTRRSTSGPSKPEACWSGRS